MNRGSTVSMPASLKPRDEACASVSDALAGTVLTYVGLPGLMPLPWWLTLTLFGYAAVSCLVVNDAVKVAMIRWSGLDRESGSVAA